MLQVWGRRNSQNVQKVMWLVGELDLPHEHIPAGGAFGRLSDPEYGALNPNRLGPGLGVAHDRAVPGGEVRRTEVLAAGRRGKISLRSLDGLVSGPLATGLSHR